MRIAITFCIAAILLMPSSARAASPAELRATAQKSIQFVKAKGVYWIESKNCTSSHPIGNMVWGLTAAQKGGLQVSDQLDEWLECSNRDVMSKTEKGDIKGTKNKTGVVQIIQANAVQGTDKYAELTRKLIPLLLTNQNEDGSWKPGGQLPSQKRDKAETTQVATMWIALAIIQNSPNTEPPTQLTKALAYFKDKPNGKSAEWYLASSLLARQLGNDELAEKRIAQLLAAQQDDGGWGWNLDEASNALATGMAFYALSKAKPTKLNSNSIIKDRDFLVSTQNNNGSWRVNRTKINKRDAPIETSIYWGATWALLGLSETMT